MNFTDELVYEADYKDKLKLFIEMLELRYGKATELNSIRGKLSRIEIKGNAVNQIVLSDAKQSLDNCCVVSVKQDATIHQVYIDLDSIELILSDATLQIEFFEKMAGHASNCYSIQEKQVDNIGLLLRFLK